MSKRGRPFEPGNQIGRGRPRGSRNKRTLIGKELLEEHGDALVRKTLVLALQGDTVLLRALLPYILSRPKDLPVATGPLPMTTVDDLAKTFETVMDSIATGHLPLDQGQGIIHLLEVRRHLIQTEEFDARIKKLEQSLLNHATPSEAGSE